MKTYSLGFSGITACMLLLSCTEENPVDQEEKKLRYVFVTTCVNEDFFKPVQKGMQDAAHLMDVECSFIGTEDVDVQGQVEVMRKAIEEGVDGIALNIIDSVGFDEIVTEARSRGIPVVAFNSDDNYTPNARMSSVCQNLYKAGRELGQKMEPEISSNSNVLLTIHSEGISALDERVRGIKDALKHLDLSYDMVITGTKVDSASNVIAAALRKNPKITRVLCTGLADTEGAGNAIEQGLSEMGIVAAGFDLSAGILDHVKNGNLLFTIDQQPYMQGFYPVVQLAQYSLYGIVPSDNEIGAAFVTKENVEDVEELTAKGYR